MKKIGILTLDGIVNYGNRLQNYAVQTILQKEGFEAKTIIAKDNILKVIVNDLRTLLKNPRKTISFIKFNARYIKIHRMSSKNGDINKRIADRYDYFVVGSDQVWNPNIRKRERNKFFLRFARPEQRVAVAASFSVNELEQEYIESYRKGISEFKAISVREFEGAKIVKEICGRDAAVLCDPTMVLCPEEWDRIANTRIKNLPEKYLLTYFLGEVPKEREEAIKDYAKSYGLQIVDLNNKTDKRISKAGPAEFIGLIKKATVVCTDSFHGVAFSSIYNIPFWAFKRESKLVVCLNTESRIITLQEKLGIEGRLVNRLSADMKYDYDFGEANKRIKLERQAFKEFLKKAFEY